MSHPMVMHFWEEHGGRRQEILMHTISSHLTALDRQAAESVNILEAARIPEESLNQKSEWGGAKIPALLVTSPKGTADFSCRKDSFHTYHMALFPYLA